MRKTVCFLIPLVAFVVLSVCPAAGLAQSLDQLLVVDDAQIFGNRIAEVETAASKLINLGADVRVRTIFSYGTAGNLDLYEEQLERQNPSWTGPDGNRKNNLIVIIVTLQERQTGLYYGTHWEAVIGNKWMSIQTDIMNPLYRSGDYVEGTVKGLEEIQRLIQGGGSTEPASPTGPGLSIWWIIIILGAGLLIVGLFLFGSYRTNRAKRQAARQKAMLAKQGAASSINELLEVVRMLEIKVDVMAEKIAQEEVAPLRDSLEKAKLLINQSSQTYSELSHSAGDPENPKLGEAELGAIEAEYQKILGNLRQAREEIRGVEEQIAAVQQAITDFPGRVGEVESAMEEVLNKQEDLKKAGLKAVYSGDLIAKARTILEQAQDLFSKKRFNEGLKQALLARDEARQALQAAEELPRKKEEAEAAISALPARIEQLKEKIDKGRDVFEMLAQNHAESAWESVRGNGTEAENRIDWAMEALEDARAATEMEQQEWYKALELVDKGNGWLAEAESLMKSISELESNLVTAQRDAPNEISAAQADISKAWEYINKYDEDIRESLEEDLRAAEKNNSIASEELNKTQPDFLLAVKLAREANAAADKILAQARDEHETAERLRAKALSVRRDAYTKLSIAREYIQDHNYVVKNEARDHLNNAIEFWRQADLATDIQTKVSLMEKVESEADQAYSLARTDVFDRGEDIAPSGAPDLGRRTPRVVIVPSGSWGSRRSSGSGHSISSSRPTSMGGSVSRGGGGSTSWGSKGGGSKGW